MGAGRRRVADGQDGQIGLVPAVEPGQDVDERLVVEELCRVAGGEAGPGAHLDATHRGQRVGRQVVGDLDGGCVLLAEVGDHARGEDVGDLLRRVILREIERQAHVVEVGEHVVDPNGQLVGGRRVVAHRRARRPVKGTVVRQERRRAARGQHPGRVLERVGDRLQPVVDQPTG